jgi:serine protease Do
MSKLFQRLTLAGITCFALTASQGAWAQEQKKDTLGEFDEIIIKPKGTLNGKVTVEIKEGEVWVDGQKMDQYKDGNIAVFRRKVTPIDGNKFSFGNTPQNGMQFFNFPEGEGGNLFPKENSAVLGVITEKKEAAGATIKTVAPKSAAEKAGLKSGDVITKINDEKISEPADLFETISNLKPGEKVTITYLRNKKQSTTTATLGKRDAADMGKLNMIPPGSGDNIFSFPPRQRGQGFGELFENFNNDSKGPKLGLYVQNAEKEEGATVLEVRPGSIAEKAGFKVADIITELAGTPVKNARDVTAAYRQNSNKEAITATIKRDGKTKTLEITIPKKGTTADL